MNDQKNLKIIISNSSHQWINKLGYEYS